MDTEPQLEAQKTLKLKEILYFQMLLIDVGMTRNAWTWIQIVAKGCIRAIYCSTG